MLENMKQVYLKDKTEFIFQAAGLISAVLTAAGFSFLFLKRIDMLVFSLTFVFAMLFQGFLLAYVLHLYSNLIRDYNINVYSREKFSMVAENLHSYHHEYRRMMSSILAALHSPASEDFAKVKNSYAKFIEAMIKAIGRTFSALTNDECMVSIELVYAKPEDQTVFYITTLGSDEKLERRCGKRDNVSFLANDAFKDLMDTAEYKPSFQSNDLKKDNFHNDHARNWHECYNACQIVAVRPPADRKELGSPVAFICVYNKKGNFDTEITYNFLSDFTDSFFNLHRSLDELERKSSS